LAGGLVSRVRAADELLPSARALAREIADNTSAVSVALSRQMLWKMLGESNPREAHCIESQGIDYMGQSADAREGVLSFLEKRPAKFTMRPSRDLPPFYPWWK
jgi:enoyl-CoA hydratase/carnithine racemase